MSRNGALEAIDRVVNRGGDVLQAARGRMGEILSREAPAPTADLVIAVPDSGNPAAR